MLSKLPFYGFYPALCSLISSFLSGRSIAAVVDGHYSTSKPINSGVPQEPTLFLLFINDLSLTNWPIHSYADDTTLHYSTSFDRHPNLQELQISRNDAAERLTSDLSITVNPLLSGIIEPQGPPDMGKTRIWCRLSLRTFPPYGAGFFSKFLCAYLLDTGPECPFVVI